MHLSIPALWWPGDRAARHLPIYHDQDHEYTGLVGEPESFDEADREGLAGHDDPPSPTKSSRSPHDHFNDVELFQEGDEKNDHDVTLSSDWRPPYHTGDRPSTSSSPATTLDSLDSYHMPKSNVHTSHKHTLHVSTPPSKSSMKSIGIMVVYLAEWLLVGAAFALLITGGVVYSGTCRATYKNGCLAHLISAFRHNLHFRTTHLIHITLSFLLLFLSQRAACSSSMA